MKSTLVSWAFASWFVRVLATRYITTNVEYGGTTEVEPGQCFSVFCVISMFDPYRWTRNGIPLDRRTSGVRFRNETNLFNQRKLVIDVDSATQRQVGEFRCVDFTRQFHHTRLKGATTQEPETSGVLLTSGESLTLDCPVDIVNQTVQWFKNTREVEDSGRVLLEDTRLYIPEATVSDAGEYVCWVGDGGPGHVIAVTHKPWVEPWPSSETEISEGENIILTCKMFGFPPPKVTWFVGNVILSHLHRGSDLIAVDPPFDQQPGEHELQLINAALSDEALYTCRGHNEYGSHETSMYLRVRANHIITNLEHSERILLVKLGSSFSLQCNSSHPKGRLIQWLRNDGLVRSDNESGIYVVESNNSLLIMKARKSDLGEYMCIMQRPGSIDSARIFVHEQMLTMIGSDSESESENKLVVMKPGENLTLQCNSSQDWEFVWYKDGELLEIPSRILVSGRTLVVMNATEKDAGLYMCVVRGDQVGRFINASVSVAVAPEIVPFPVSEAAKESFKWQIHCQVTTGVPEPQLFWFKDGELIDEHATEHESGPNNRIHIRSGLRSSVLVWDYLVASDRGHYTCLADNGVAQPTNTTLFLRVRSKWAALWPFLGICCEVIILAVTIILSSKSQASQDIT